MKFIISALVLIAYLQVSAVQYNFHRVSDYTGPNFTIGGLSDDGQWILGTYNSDSSDSQSVVINRQTLLQIAVPSNGAIVVIPQRLFSSGEVLGRNRLLSSSGMPGNRPFLYDPSTQIKLQLPMPLDPTNYIFDVHDVLNDDEFIGKLWREIGGEARYARYTRTNGVWTATLISTGSSIYTVCGYDSEGYIYGQYGTQPCRWDRDLNRTILSSNAATPNGQVAGRLPDGRYAGMLYYNNFGVHLTSVVTWDNLSAAPVVHGNWNAGTFSVGPLSYSGSMILRSSGIAGTQIWDPVDGLRHPDQSIVNLPSGISISSLTSVTKFGFMYGSIPGDKVILDPVPEPASLAALALGLLPLLRKRRC